MKTGCRLVKHGFKQGSCLTYTDDQRDRACRTTLKWKDDTPYRLIHSHAHKAPECYLSIYQSGCNWSCLKCHSWRFSQHAQGEWMSPQDITKLALKYEERNRDTLYREPRDHATSWHANDLCHACGSCLLSGKRSRFCPGKLSLDQITFLDDGTFGPARNIVSFTGGDLACQPEFYALAAQGIKRLRRDLWVLFETNGYGLTPENLDLFGEAGIDSFWLDIKAYTNSVHKKLTGVSNQRILQLPSEIKEKGFILEVLSLYIPGWVETRQIRMIAELLAQVDSTIPFTILAFFPEHKLSHVPPPNLQQMISAYNAARDAGLTKVKLGNIGVFIKNKLDHETLNLIGAL